MRLTFRNGGKLALRSLNNEEEMVANKLGQLEDIEEELGVDLITLFKALKNGFYYKVVNDGFPNKIRFADNDNEECGIEYYGTKKYGITWASLGVAYVKDYGKNWALTKEELL